MRTVHWLFVVSVALFVFGVGFIVAGARTLRHAAPVEVPITTPVASIRQIMNGITGPAATAVYDSVGTIVNADGITEIAPQNDEEWTALADQAAALVESGNLLLIGTRVVDEGDWVTMTRSFMDAAHLALEAAVAQDTEAILTAGTTLNDTCDTCHAKYQRQ